MINFFLNRAVCIATYGCLYLEGHFSGPVNHSFFIFFFILICTQEGGVSTNLNAQGHIFKLSIFGILFFFFFLRNKYDLLLKKKKSTSTKGKMFGKTPSIHTNE